MKRILSLIMLPCLLIVLISQRPARVPGSKYVDGELMVQFKHESALRSETMVTALSTDFRQVDLKMVKVLSGSMNIFLFKFSPGIIPDEQLLREIKNHRLVSQAQFNHFIELRENIPNDDNFNLQWNMHNIGQNGGTPGADVSGPEAWDVATGGVTALGDTIVICIVDDGFDLSHNDLSFWKNHHEIPFNGIDDDSNGYIDDYDGWSAYTHSGHITSADHGTHVSGIAAAIGNNDLGVCGINWKTKVLPVQGNSSVESVVVEGYAYVYDMRKLYNQTNGQKGAFIVSTNSSFGVDYGQPADYPIWGAMYDSMGMVGILSAAATANADWNIDSIGDVPTAFPSDYLISVTNTTNKDVKYPNAAWGATTIDLGAPGTNIYSTRQNNSYGSKSGCSMASPHVAGAVALLYSAADPDFLEAYRNDPAGMALVVKQYILNGTDSIASLQGITVTGGRLNLLKAIMQMENPMIIFDPLSIHKVLPQDSVDLSTFTMTDNIPCALDFEITWPDTVNWISIDPSSGFLDPGNSIPITVTINTEGMPTGTYYTALNIEYGGTFQYVMPVHLKVNPFEGITKPLIDYQIAALAVCPNPFTDQIKASIKLASRADVSLIVYNQAGSLVRHLADNNMLQGNYEFTWNGTDDGGSQLPAGVYILRLSTGKEIITRKLVKIR